MPLHELAYAGTVFKGCLQEPTRCRLCLPGHPFFEALEPQTTNITTNQGKMNEFELLPTSVCTKPTRCRPKQAYANAYATYAIYNMSCGVPTLSIVLHPLKKKTTHLEVTSLTILTISSEVVM